MFVRSIIIITLNKKWVTINNLNDILYGTLCTKNWAYISVSVSVKYRYDFIIVTGQVLIDIKNDVILAISISSDYVPMMV